MKSLIIMGTRPHFIKVAPLLRAARKYDDLEIVLVHTGQHYDHLMSDVFLQELDFPVVDYNLEVGSGSHGVQTGLMLMRLDPILLKEKPDVVLVPGDTNSTLAGCLAAYKLQFKAGHIEAGLREYTWRPEEMNKIVADQCSDYCFCPIERACANLKKENIDERRIFLTGDITFDLFRWFKAENRFSFPQIENFNAAEPFAVLTMHRAETVDLKDKLDEILTTLNEIDIQIVFPIHPRTRLRIQEFGLQEKLNKYRHIIQTEPLGYREFGGLLTQAALVMTDSSGVLKEAFYAQTPSIVLDDTTEYAEIFETGYSILSGKQKSAIVNGVKVMLSKRLPQLTNNPFGDGTAAEQIWEIVYKHSSL